jgi:hypothetical protein
MKGFYIQEQFQADLHPTLNLKRKIRPITGHEGPEENRGIALLFLKPRRWMGVDDIRHTPAALSSGMRRGNHCTEGLMGHGAGMDG